MARPTGFASRLAGVAAAEFALYGEGRAADAVFADRIRSYWQESGMGGCDATAPWSAAFISWCVQQAGAAAGDFLTSSRHAAYVYRAIRDARAGRGCFRGMPCDAAPLLPGDILQFNQPGGSFDFSHAERHAQYASEAAIVVALVRDSQGQAALTVGGGEGMRLRRRRVDLGGDGRIAGQAGHGFIAMVRPVAEGAGQ